MAITLNGGTGVITGVAVGGLPDGVVDSGTLATNSVDSAELIDGSIDVSHLASGVRGKILQVVHNSTTTNYTVSASDADVTNHTLAITPTSATSTIMLFTRTNYYYSASDSGWSMTIRRSVGGDTDVYSDSTAYAYYGESGATNRRGEISLNYKDSPATTSAITYKVRARKNSGTITLNENSIGSITAFEIGA